MYDDIAGLPKERRREIAAEKWAALPSVIHEIFKMAPKRAMYESLRRLNVPAEPARAVEWFYQTRDGGLIMTVWHDHIQKSPEGSIVYYIPVKSWRGTGPQPARAQKLKDILIGVLGQKVQALLLQHEWDKNDTQFAKCIAIDQRKWLVERLSEDEFLLWRGGKGKPEAA